MTTPRAENRRSRGSYFSWQPAEEGACPVETFHLQTGDPGAPVLLPNHGWPASSIDWFDLAGQLTARFRLCAPDLPGYGFSGKPHGWGCRAVPAVPAADDRIARAAEPAGRGDGEVVVLQAAGRGQADAARLEQLFTEARQAGRAEFIAGCGKSGAEIDSEIAKGKFTPAEPEDEEVTVTAGTGAAQ